MLLPGPSQGPKSSRTLPNFLPLPNVAHLPASGTLKIDKRVIAKPKLRAIARL